MSNIYKGSCLCGAITYQLNREIKNVSHCHCEQCQKQHGAAFATYGCVLRSDLVYLSGSAHLTKFTQENKTVRNFCKICGSNITWHENKKYPDWVSITIATLDTPFNPKKITDRYLKSKSSATMIIKGVCRRRKRADT